MGTGRRCILAPLLLAVLLLLPACEKAAPVAAAVTPTPTAAEPSATPTPENPVRLAFAPYEAALEGVKAQVDAAAAEEIEHLPHALDLERFIQRIQYFFLGVSDLSWSNENYWDGYTLGAADGTGSVSGTQGRASFQCSISGGGRIVGNLNGDSLSAEWQASEEVETMPSPEPDDSEEYPLDPQLATVWHAERSARLWREGEAYMAQVWWDGLYSLARLEGGACAFVCDVSALPAYGGQDESWADWSLTDGKITEYTQEGEAVDEG